MSHRYVRILLAVMLAGIASRLQGRGSAWKSTFFEGETTMERFIRLLLMVVVNAALNVTLLLTGANAATEEAPKPVEVVNMPTNPALVWDVNRDRPPKEPTQRETTCHILPGQNVCFIVFGLVPGEAMVIEMVSVSAISDLVGQHRFRAHIEASLFSVPLALEPLGYFPFVGDAFQDHFLVNQPIRLYALNEVRATVYRSDSSGDSSARVRLIGYKLDCGGPGAFCTPP